LSEYQIDFLSVENKKTEHFNINNDKVDINKTKQYQKKFVVD